MKDIYTYWGYLDLENDKVVFPDLAPLEVQYDNEDSIQEVVQVGLTEHLFGLEVANEAIPEPKSIVQLSKEYPAKSFLSFIAFMASVRSNAQNKNVRKNVLIDKTLNDIAERLSINFSETLRDALELRLMVKEPQSVKVVKIGDIRRKTGRTIEEIADKSRIPLSRLSAIETGTRIMTEKERLKLAKAFDCEEKDLIGAPSLYHPSDISTALAAIQREGVLDGMYGRKEEDLQGFVMLMNDMWKWYRGMRIGWQEAAESKVTRFKKELVRYLMDEMNDHPINVFPFTALGFNGPATFWVEIYEEDEVANGRYTVVLENIIGTSVTNNCENFIPALVETILKDRFYWGELPKQRKGHKYPEICFMERQVDEGAERYFEIMLFPNGPQWKESKLELLEKQSSKSRTYRYIVRAKDLPDPFSKKPGNDRCGEWKGDGCPLVTGIAPDPNYGCVKCSDIARVWRAREWLLSFLSDDEIRNMGRSSEFQIKHPELLASMAQKFTHDDLEGARQLFYYIQEYGGYERMGSITVINNPGYETTYIDGRHRTKVAQILDITIPVMYSTYEYMPFELME
ncbi:hypothetical protein A7K91_22570 [Paenibacillus oryzae]|uniref:HTH cro/C1-type domain-containing protein n=1 Tax=Paenibacillus oryzae TaxID=1844972 RepID=A0A1A5YQ21_9BACL|nr:helix-turn-helix transcriptional regulator [Paenibacillus oryzae]OBR67663.1 hypothetical protein A7K91_22570 [Paenibacillus oryzae]